MNRQERDRYERNDYNRHEPYGRDDERYHSTRNLTNEFEREYRQERGSGYEEHDRNRPHRSYHESDMGDAYERLSRERERGSFRNEPAYNRPEQGREYAGSFGSDRSRLNTYRDDIRNEQEKYRPDRERTPDYDDMRPRYERSGRYDSGSSDDSRRRRHEQDQYGYSWGGYGSSHHTGRSYGDYRPVDEGRHGRGIRREDNWYGSGHRSDELNRYY